MCRVEGCHGPRGSTGLCPDHYAEDLARRALARFGPRKPTWPGPAEGPGRQAAAPGPPPTRPECSAEECNREAKSRGMCSKHWQRDRISGLPPCAIDGCERNQLARSLCGTHYSRLRKATP